MDSLPPSIDHLVYATPDLEATLRSLAELLGVEAAPGGRHPLWGTRNALLSLGGRAYFEIVGPDPTQKPPPLPRPFGIDGLSAPRLQTWVVRGENLDPLVSRARAAGLELGTVEARSREKPDGTLLRWTMTDPYREREGGVIPFLIDWGSTPHPASTSPAGCSLVALRAEHPDPERVRALLAGLGALIPVSSAPRPRLVATISSPRGVHEIS